MAASSHRKLNEPRLRNHKSRGVVRVAVLLTAISVAFAGVSPAIAQDDFKLIKVEQDVRNLERQVGDLNRQVDELRRELGDRRTSSTRSGRSAAQAPSTQWINGAAWERVRAGMDELQVIDVLGPPTSMRVEGDARTLLYALEIGSSGFLSGSVTLKEKKVSQVEKPALK
jgi:hypothetical protein